MNFGRLAAAAAATLGLVATASAGNGSNFQQLLNGEDFFYGGFFNPNNPVGTHGVWRCIPADVLHAPTMVTDPAQAGFTQGTYAAKISALHIAVAGSTGSTAIWPSIVLSSSDGDCRIAPGGTLNFGFASTSTVFATTGLGFFGVGPLNGTVPGTVNILAALLNAGFGGPFQAGPSGAIVYGVQFNLTAIFGSPSNITVPGGESVTYWASERFNQAPGNYQYWAASEDERSICSSLSNLASAIGTPNGAVFAMPTNREFGMFIATEDATLMVGVGPTMAATDIGVPNTTMGGANPMDTGTGGRTISLTGTTPEGGTGTGFDTLSFNSYDEGNIFGGSGKLIFANLMAVNLAGAASCGPWSAGYLGIPSGGPGGPVLSNVIPTNPRIVGQLDSVSINLITNPVWTGATLHNVAPGGNEYPMFPGFPSLMGGSSGNNGGFGIPIPNLPVLVGVQLFFSGVGLNASNTAIAKTADNGHSHQNGYATIFHP
jgi:hypothetical protein